MVLNYYIYYYIVYIFSKDIRKFGLMGVQLKLFIILSRITKFPNLMFWQTVQPTYLSNELLIVKKLL